MGRQYCGRRNKAITQENRGSGGNEESVFEERKEG